MRISSVLVALASVEIGSSLEHSAFVDWDASTGNILFRTGNSLESNSSGIDFDPLMAQFKTAAEKAGAKWPNEYFVQDCSLWTGESDYISAEKLYWETHPEQGNVTHWPILGMYTATLQAGCKMDGISTCGDWTKQPQSFSADDVTTLSNNFKKWGNTDDLENRLASVYEALHTKMVKPQVIFFHCTVSDDPSPQPPHLLISIFFSADAIALENLPLRMPSSTSTRRGQMPYSTMLT